MSGGKPDRRKKAVCRHCGATITRETTQLPWGHSPAFLDREHAPEPFPHGGGQ